MHASTHYSPIVRRSAGLEGWVLPIVIGIIVVAVVSGAIILCKCCGPHGIDSTTWRGGGSTGGEIKGGGIIMIAGMVGKAT